MNFYIFRHAETRNSKYHLPYPEDGGREVEILAGNLGVIKRLADHLARQKIEVFFSSPFKRCLQTAEIIEREARVKFMIDQRLSEEMLTRDQESFEDLEKRISSFIAEIKAKNYQSVAICSHGWPLACLIGLITKGDVTKEDFKYYPKPGVLICLENQKLKEIDFRTGKPKPKAPEH